MKIAIVLAAGEARRMGEPKSLLTFANGTTLLEDQIVRLVSAGIEKTIVVVGANAEAITARHKSLCVSWVNNENWRLGPFSSIQAALKHISPLPHGLLLLPVDTAGVSTDTIRTIVELGERSDRPIIPEHCGRGGHPVYLTAQIAKEALQLPAATGRLDLLLAAHKPHRIAVLDPAVLLNLNTPDDWEKFRATLKNV